MKKIILFAVTAGVVAACTGTIAMAVTYNGATEFTSSTETTGQTYTSSTASQNALLVSGGASTITNATVTKTGSPSGSSDDYDFYGVNAAVLVYNGATLNVSGGTFTTNASYASALYAYGTGKIVISDSSTIKTTSNNSGGIMVTGGGTITGSDMTIETSGDSSAAIRSDKGGGTINVSGVTATTSGNGSPTIYSTADISVSDSTLTSTTSEGVVVEGENSVTLEGTTLNATNNKLNGQSTTYKGVFLYQSMSGDASDGVSYFIAEDSTINNNYGDVFYVTNNTAKIALTNTTVTQNGTGYLLRAQEDAWGTSGSNGATVTLSAVNQTIDAGDIYIGSSSSLTMQMWNESSFTGRIDNQGTTDLHISADSTWIISGENYLTSLLDSDKTYSNIDNPDSSVSYILCVNNVLIKKSDDVTSTTCTSSSDDDEDEDTSEQLVADGVYIIRSALNSNKVLDIAGASDSSGANLQLYSDNGTVAQKFIIRHLGSNVYQIENLKSAKQLDVAGASTADGANVQQYVGNSSCAQKWTIKKTSDNYYSFVSSCGNKCLDIAGASTADGANIQLYTGNGSNAQKFSLTKIVEVPTTQLFSNGNYVIKSALDSNKVLDVAGANTTNSANVQLYTANGSAAQTFQLTYLADGFYQIMNKNSKKVLDVAGAGTNNGANVQQYASNGSIAQQWLIVETSDGYYSFISRCNGLYLDIAGGSTENGVNVQIYAGNSSNAQKFTLVSD